jgi:hypothetical protein
MSDASWTFFAVDGPTAFAFMWHWRKQSAGSTLTSVPFAFYFDCVADARASGYTGALPAGPKVALPAVPKESIGTKQAAVPKRARDAATAAPLITVVELSAAVARRRLSGRSRVE